MNRGDRISEKDAVLSSFGASMNHRKSNRECAQLLYEALEPDRWYSRLEILAMGLLNPDEFGRARKILVESGALGFQPTRVASKPAYILTGEPFAPSVTNLHRRQTMEDPCFLPLLDVWQINLPAGETPARNVVNHRFDKDTELERQ